MSIQVGQLVVDLTANTASFVSGMDKAGQIALTSSKNIEKALKAMGGTIVTAMTAAEAAVAAMVDSSLENMARLADVSQSTGVTTEALSALEYAAKQSGVSTESLDGALSKMAKSMEKAAAQGASGSNAYRTLGIAVTDAHGKLRPTADVLEDLAKKFASFKDGPEKTALAMQIFGRSGAEMVPLLNRGKEGIAELVDEAKRLGQVIDSDTAEAAKRFEESMNRLGASARGAVNQITASLLPQLQYLMDQLSEGTQDASGHFKDFLNVVGVAGKSFIVAFGGLQAVIDEIGIAIKHTAADFLILIDEAPKLLKAFANPFNAKGQIEAMDEFVTRFGYNQKLAADEGEKIWKDYAAGVSEFWNAKPGTPSKANPNGGKLDAPKTPNAEAGKEAETIAKRISDLQKQAALEVALAAAKRDDTAATVEATAAAQAREFIDKANADLKQKGAGALTASQRATVLAAEAEKAFSSVAKETNKSLADTTTKTREQTAGVEAMAAAYSKGGAAIAEAQQAAQLAPFQEKVRQLEAAYQQLVAVNPKATKETQAMAAALAQAKAELAATKQALDEYAAAQRQANTDRQSTDLEREIASTRQYAVAVMQSADAMRDFEIVQKVTDFQNNAGFSQAADALEKYRQQLKALFDAEDQKAIADKVHAANRQSDLQKEIDLLNRLRAATLATGQSTLTIDGLIHQAETQKRQDLDNQLLQTNSVKNGFKAFFDQYANSGVTSAQRVDQVMTQTLGNFNSTLSEQLLTGQANWKNFEKAAVSSLVEIGIQELEGWLIHKFLQKSKQTTDATSAATGTYAALASIPIIGPGIAAAGAAASYAAVLAFRQGGVVPGDNDDGVPALLHPREMVLPERIAKTVTDAVSGNGGGDSGGGDTHNHYSPQVNAGFASASEIDARLKGHFDRWAREHARKRGQRV